MSHILKNLTEISFKPFNILCILIVIHVFYFTVLSFLRFDNFNAGRYDLGNMDQVVWNTARGRIFEMSSDNNGGISSISRLHAHADFILVLLAPFYFIWESPKMLLFLQTLCIAFGAYFVFQIAHKTLKNDWIALILSFSYLINPALNFANLYDFHAVTLSTTFLLGAWYFLMIQKFYIFTLFILLAALTKEQVWAIVALFGVYLTIIKREKRGVVLFFIGGFLFYFFIWYAIPMIRGGDHFAISYYSELGSSATNISKSILLSPDKIILSVFESKKNDYLQQLFQPLLFLPLLAPQYLVFTIPDFLINLLSNNTNLHTIYYQYTSTITPFLFIASILGIKNFKRLFPKFPMFIIGIVLFLSSFYSAYSFGPLFFAKRPNLDMVRKPQLNREIIQRELANIDSSKSVSATNNIGAHLSHRTTIFTVPVGVEKAEVLAFLLGDPFAQPSPEAQKNLALGLKKNKNYKILFELNNFIIFEKTN